jgi:ABC-type amino acid transport substrate-binding protein
MKTLKVIISSIILASAFMGMNAYAAHDLAEVKASGVLRHLGLPYANFITGSGDGLDMELMQLFATHLGVKYEYVETSWKNIIGDLTGRRAKGKGAEAELLDEVPVRGDVISNGFTVLPWRAQVVDFSAPTFPTQVWLLTRADYGMTPVKPTGDLAKDILQTKAKFQGEKLLGMPNTCLDFTLYKLADEKVVLQEVTGNLNEIAPRLMAGEAEAAILDVPDALVAMEKWPGQIKIIGPISGQQTMATAFRKDATQLREAFNAFLEQCKKDGTYVRLVKKYYPAVFDYYPDFFKDAVMK